MIECVFSPCCVCVSAPEPWNRYTSISRASSEERAKPDKIERIDVVKSWMFFDNYVNQHLNLTKTYQDSALATKAGIR